MDQIIKDIEVIIRDLNDYEIISKGSVFSSNEESRSHIKLKWIKMCMFEEEINTLVNKIRVMPGIASTNIPSPTHPECIQFLNTMMAILSPQIHTRDCCKMLEEYMESYENFKENPDILNAIQSFRMNKIRLNFISHLSSFSEHLTRSKKDIEMWCKRSRSDHLAMHT
jgi:hypothetical protein